MDPLINISSPDPISAVCNAIIAGCEVAKEYVKFLQTPSGQEVAKQQLQDWQEIKAAVKDISQKIDAAFAGAREQISKVK